MSGNSFNDLPGYIVDATGTYTYNASAITSEQMSAPITIMAIIYPIISAPACILCLAPMVWHFRQANIAAGSLIAWILFHNFFNSINPLIWPRDNLLEWWNGQIWCDVQVRFQVGSYVGLTASLTLVLRKLAHVLDTRNITVSTSHGSKVKAKVWEVFWCWIVPFIFMAVYYVVQSVRYAIIGIAGCWSLHDGSWPSMVLGFMWSAVGILFATYWASLLIYRLYRYRREFHRLVAARNTTSSRFVRLFLVSLIIILFYLPYTIFLLVAMSARIEGSYSWRKVHNPETFNAVMREPAFGQISFEKWVQIATGYIIFLFLGTGVDANAHYRRLLVYVGADKIWPSLRDGSGNRSRTPNDFSTLRGWTASWSSKAKKMLWSSKSATMNTDSTNDTWTASTCTNSVALDSIPRLHNVSTQDTLISQKNVKDTATPSPNSPPPSFFSRYFSRPSLNGPHLPLFSYRNITEIASTKSSNSTHPTSPATTDTNDLSTSSMTPIGVHARAWATDISSASPTAAKTNDGHAYGNNVHVVREVHQQREHRSEKGCELERVDKEMRDWA